MFLYGVVVLGAHLRAELRSSPPASCVLEMRPWLVSAPACALVELNCHNTPQYTGAYEDQYAIFGQLSLMSLEHVVFRHCTRIQIPYHIQLADSLVGFKIYDSTVMNWAADAALTETHHRRLRFAFFVRTNFSNATLPDGLLSHDFPRLLRDLEFSVTNLASVPEDLHQRWPPGVALCLEFSQLTQFPLTFTKAGFFTLTLHWNHITALPPEAFMQPSVGYLAVTGNLIAEFPEGVDVSQLSLYYLLIDSTNVSTFASWTKMFIVAGRTPLCRDFILALNATERAARPWLRRINCTDGGDGEYGVYPLEVEVLPEEFI